MSDASVPTGPGSCRATYATLCSSTPLLVAMPPGVTVTAASVGYDDVAVLDTTGRVWTWGTSAVGACSGLGGTDAVSTPTAVVAPGVRFTAIAATQASQFGAQNMVALDSRGQVWVWGSDALVQLSTGSSQCPSPAPSEPAFGTPAAQMCVLEPAVLPSLSGVSFKGVAATPTAVFGFPR